MKVRFGVERKREPGESSCSGARKEHPKGSVGHGEIQVVKAFFLGND